MEKGLVSILIPVYNVEKYLPTLFDSIEQQKYPHVEVIFVNDGSTDNSLKLLNNFCHKHKYAKVFTQKNQGLPSARNTAIKHAKGEFAYIVDSDDVMNIYAIDEMVNIQEQTGADLVASNFKFISDGKKFSDIKQKHKKKPRIKIITDNNEICYVYLLKFKSSFTRTVWNKLIRMEVVKSLDKWPNVWDPKIICGEDNYFLSKYLLKCKKVCCISDKLYFYRKRVNSISRKSFNPNYYTFLRSSDIFLSLDKEKYKDTIGAAQALQSVLAYWLLQEMKWADYYEKGKTEWVYSEYKKYAAQTKKYWKKSLIEMMHRNWWAKHILKKLQKAHANEKGKN